MSSRKREYFKSDSSRSSRKRLRFDYNSRNSDRSSTKNDDRSRTISTAQDDAFTKPKAKIQSLNSSRDSLSSSKPKYIYPASNDSKQKKSTFAERIAERRRLLNGEGESPSETARPLGLNVELHPLLRESIVLKSENTSFTENENAKIKNAKLQQKLRPGVSKFDLNPYFDPNDFQVKDPSMKKKKRQLVFNEKGKYIDKAIQIRKEIEEKQQREKELLERKLDTVNNPIESLGESNYQPKKPPLVEWWDYPILLPNTTYNDLKFDEESKELVNLSEKIKSENITHYVQHPIPINAPWEKHLPPMKPLYLTKKEIKRMRKNRRQEIYKDKQDKIKLGLEPAPPPKVKLKNLMNVLTNEAIKDPTLVEMKVKRDIELRKLNHFKANEDRKLSSEQKMEKFMTKLENDKNYNGYFTNVYKISKLIHPKHKFLVNVNATQLNLLGIGIIVKNEFSLVIVEGGNKGIRFFQNLMLNRIKWEENVEPKKK
ncbi:U4/U6-U5 snRNP complex subunit PRP3, partial [Ascoidea rubescens DSM 1968]